MNEDRPVNVVCRLCGHEAGNVEEAQRMLKDFENQSNHSWEDLAAINAEAYISLVATLMRDKTRIARYDN